MQEEKWMILEITSDKVTALQQRSRNMGLKATSPQNTDEIKEVLQKILARLDKIEERVTIIEKELIEIRRKP